MTQPVLDFAAMAQIRDIDQVTAKKFRSYELDITYPAAWGSEGIEARWRRCARAPSTRCKAATTS